MTSTEYPESCLLHHPYPVTFHRIREMKQVCTPYPPSPIPQALSPNPYPEALSPAPIPQALTPKYQTTQNSDFFAGQVSQLRRPCHHVGMQGLVRTCQNHLTGSGLLEISCMYSGVYMFTRFRDYVERFRKVAGARKGP